LKEAIGCLRPERAPVEWNDKQQSEEILAALIESNGQVGGPAGAAARLRVNRTTLIARMKKLGIDPKRFVRTESGVEREPFLPRQEVLDEGSDLGPGELRIPSLQGQAENAHYENFFQHESN